MTNQIEEQFPNLEQVDKERVLRYTMSMAKPLSLLFFLILSPVLWSEVEPLRKGDDPSRILEVLGEPHSFMKTDKQGVYFYPRGEVHTRHGKVSQIFLLSEKEFETQQVAQAIERERRKAEGEQALSTVLATGRIETLSGRAQLSYWSSFAQRYPEVDIQAQLIPAQELAREEQAKEAEAQRLAKLEQRVLEAEIRAAQAQEQAARAQQQASLTSSTRTVVTYPTWGYPIRYYGGCSKRRYYDKHDNPAILPSTTIRSNPENSWRVTNWIGTSSRSNVTFYRHSY